MIEHSLKDQIIELESENMPAVLRASGIEFDPKKLLENLDTEQNIVTIILNNKLMALLRYKIEIDRTAFIYSIQIRNPRINKALVYPLIKKAVKQFEIEGIEEVISVVQSANHESIKFNEKLGLAVEKKFEKAIRFKGSIKTLKKHLNF